MRSITTIACAIAISALGAQAAPINQVWLGEFDESGSFPMQPGMDVGQGQDRPVGIGGLVIGLFGITTSMSANANSLSPGGLILTRGKIEAALVRAGGNAVLIPVDYTDRQELGGKYTVYVQIERLP